MALFARFFSQRKNVKKENVPQQTFSNKNTQRRHFDFELSQVRVLLFRECDWRGRKLLYDSHSKPKVADESSKSNDVTNNGQDGRMNGQSGNEQSAAVDGTMLGEAVFGAVAMLLAGPAVKVHALNSPRRLMLSAVFRCPHARVRTRQISDRSLDSSYGSSINSTSDLPLDSSNGELKSSSSSKLFVVTNHNEQQDSLNDDFECFSTCPLHNLLTTDYGSTSSVSSGRSSSGGSLTSLRRRWLRSTATAVARLDVPAADTHAHNSRTHRGTRLAVALVITSDSDQPQEMEQFLLERLPLLVQIITAVQFKAERAYMHKDSFNQIMNDASSDAAQAIHDLFCCMLIEAPLWMSITSKSQHNTELRLDLLTKFFRDLGFLLQTLDTKNSNFFMSTLLTAVLTHHLGWVPTVSDDNDSNGGDHCCYRKGQLSALSQSHPYSALWAQLDDLKGALGTPSKVARTIIIGRSESLVVKLLSVLSYFVRCGRVYSRNESKLDSADDKLLFETVIPEMKTDTSLKTETMCTVNDAKSVDNFRRRNGYFSKIDRQNTFRTVRSGNNLLLKEGAEFDPDVISDKVSKLCRVPRSAVEYHVDESPPSDDKNTLEKRYNCSQRIPQRIECERQRSCVDIKNSINRRSSSKEISTADTLSVVLEDVSKPKTSSVVFMVGDDDRLTDLTKNNMEETDKPAEEVDFISSDFTNSCSSDTDDKDGADAESATKGERLLRSNHSFPDVLRAKQKLDNSLSRASDVGDTCREARPAPVDRGKCGLSAKNESCDNLNCTSAEPETCDGEAEDCLADCKENTGPNVDCSRIYLSIPESRRDEEETEVELAASVLGGVSDHYMQCMVLQGVVENATPGSYRAWEVDLRRDLLMEVRSPVLNQHHDEAVCIIADLDTCEVRVMSSRTPAIERIAEGGSRAGIRAIMSRSVADMLEVLLHLCNMTASPEQCAEYIEAKLEELLARSQVLSEMLLSSADLLSVDTLTAALDLDTSDVALLMSVASVHSPLLASRYGITLH